MLLTNAPMVRAADIRATADQVQDGATLALDNGETVHLFGIDAPDVHQQCRRYSHCYPCGAAARAQLARLTAHNNLRCVTRGTHDDLAAVQCFVGEMDIARMMLRAGMAVADPAVLTAQDAAYRADEQLAKSQAKGMWAGEFVPFAEWRAGKRLPCGQTGNAPD
jgi:endonuclease YncB( thermonuclease family)